MLVVFAGDPGEAWPCLQLDDEGSVRERAFLAPGDTVSPDRCLLVAPGVDVLAQQVELQAGSDAQTRALARYRCEPMLAESGAQVHFAVGAQQPSGLRMVLAVRKTLMQDWLREAQQRGLDPDQIVPDYLLAVPPEDPETARVLVIGDRWAVRGAGLAFSAEADLARQVLGGRKLEVLDREFQVERAVAEGALRPDLPNLREGPFARRRASGTSQRPLALALAAVALLALPLPNLAAGFVLDAKARAADQQARAVAQRLVPNAPSSLDPLSIVRQLQAQPRSVGFVSMAAALVRAVQEVGSAQLEGLALNDDHSLRATISCAGFADLDRLRASLGRVGLSFEEGAAVNQDGRIRVDATVKGIS